jgi:hypothetical protein
LLQRLVRSVPAVVVDVVDHESVELPLVPDDGVVEQLTTKAADPAFRAMLLATGVRSGVLNTRMPSVRNTASNESVDWLPRSWLNNQGSSYVSGRAGRGTPVYDRPQPACHDDAAGAPAGYEGPHCTIRP